MGTGYLKFTFLNRVYGAIFQAMNEELVLSTVIAFPLCTCLKKREANFKKNKEKPMELYRTIMQNL